MFAKKKGQKEELQVVPASTFFVGMHVDSEIFYSYKGKFILLCKDVTLDEELIRQLHKAEAANEEIYVGRMHYDAILRQSREFQQKLQESAPPPAPPPTAKSAPVPAPKRPAEQELEYVPMDPKFKVSQAEPHLTELQKKLKTQRDYKEVTEQASVMLESVAQNDRIPEPMANDLARSVGQRLQNTDVSTLLQCINGLRGVDDYLYAHSTNVSILNGLIGRWLGLEETEIDALVRTGLLHDLGKLKISRNILNKPGPLTPEEYETVKKHSVSSYEILLASGETNERILSGVRGHHERMNGTGYPDGLQGENIPLYARVTAVSDVYDAMVARHPYKDRSSPFDILAEFATMRFSNLDMHIINTFLSRMPDELIGKRVQLSDGRSGKVVYINTNNFAYPIVKVGGEMITTSASLRCVGMDNYVSLLPD